MILALDDICGSYTNTLSTHLAKQAQMIRHAARASSRRRLPLTARHRVGEPGTPDRVSLDASPLNHTAPAPFLAKYGCCVWWK